MACTIEATAGAEDANSYATIAEGDAYHETHLYASAWEDTDDTTRCKALQMATRLLDQWWEWYGSVTDGDQALLWPRVGVVDADGFLLASDAIPPRIRDGCIELARSLIERNITAESDSRGLKMIKAGSVELEFAVATPTVQPMPDAVTSFVSIYGTKRSASGSGAVTLGRA